MSSWIQIGVRPRVMLKSEHNGRCLTSDAYHSSLFTLPCNANDDRQYWLRNYSETGGGDTWRSEKTGGCLDARFFGPARLQRCEPYYSGDYAFQVWTYYFNP